MNMMEYDRFRGIPRPSGRVCAYMANRSLLVDGHYVYGSYPETDYEPYQFFFHFTFGVLKTLGRRGEVDKTPLCEQLDKALEALV